jgi:uroporphyrinogen decarboxylase
MYQPSPNPDRLASILRHEGRPGPVPFIELFADEPIMEAVLGHPMVPAEAQGEEAHRARARSLIAFYRQLGYDYVPVQLASGLQRATAVAADTAALSRGARHWDNSTTGRITTWAEFEAYPWPRPEHIDYTPAEVLLEELPDDMGAIALGAGGVLEWVMWLMGYENLALGLYEQPDLVYAMFQRVTYTLLNTCHSLIDMDGFLAYFVGDDMGHVSGTFISPQMMRLFVFPCQQRLVELVHDHGLPFALHSCGNLSAIMDDLIDTVQIDAKHSFEDKIEPVESVHARYGRRIALLGGVDMDLLARGSEAAVRARTRQLLDALGPSGTWALGTGNTVANYIPLRNYLAMLDEGRRWNQENYGG